jgi:hypothetical protein
MWMKLLNNMVASNRIEETKTIGRSKQENKRIMFDNNILNNNLFNCVYLIYEKKNKIKYENIYFNLNKCYY